MTATITTNLLDAALAWYAAGCSAIPISADGSKAPPFPWKRYKTERADPEQLRQWFGDGSDYGIGVICGASSKEFELLEFEGRAITEGLGPQMATKMAEAGLSELWAIIGNGYVELSPGGGIHWYYRVDGPARPNTKLASRPATKAEIAADLAARPDEKPSKTKGLIETRGEGGLSVVAPTPGSHHPDSDLPWQVLIGSPATVPTISIEDRDALYAVSAQFDSVPVVERSFPAGPRVSVARGTPTGNWELRPGDDFNARASWEEILEPEGWSRYER